MNTPIRTLFSVSMACLATACGGGGDDTRAEQAVICDDALVKAGVPAAMLGFPNTDGRLSAQADGTHRVWYTMNDPIAGKQSLYAACVLRGGTLLEYTLPDGTVVPVTK